MLIKGNVISGKKRGQRLGFPTANISLKQNIPSGIYLSKTKFQNSTYPSLTFIGEAKTYEENTFQAETFLLDAKINLYNKEIEVELLEKIRENQKFKSEKDLIKAMKQDEKKAKEYFYRFPI